MAKIAFRRCRSSRPFSKNWSLNISGGVLYTAVGQRCNGTPSGVFSMDLNSPEHSDPIVPVRTRRNLGPRGSCHFAIRRRLRRNRRWAVSSRDRPVRGHDFRAVSRPETHRLLHARQSGMAHAQGSRHGRHQPGGVPVRRQGVRRGLRQGGTASSCSMRSRPAARIIGRRSTAAN